MFKPTYANRDIARIAQRDKKFRIRFIFAGTIQLISMYFMIFPLMFLDICLVIYQNTYFRLAEIQLIHRKNYLKIDRWNLPGLNLWQRMNCVYCDYGNGLIAWAHAIVAHTEIHSCAIKNSTSLLGQEHTDKYYDRSEFE